MARPWRGLSRGWLVVTACFASLFVADGVGYYSFGVFFTPLAQEFSQGRGATATVATAMRLANALANPLIGRGTDRWGAGRVMVVGALVMGACYFLLGSGVAFWQVLALYSLGALGRAAIGFVPVGTSISRWFRQQRGLAMGVAMTGVSVGGFVVARWAAELIAAFGWRGAFPVMALLVWVVVIPPVLLFIGLSPPPKAQAAQGEGAVPSPQAPTGASRERRRPLHTALGTSAFWELGAVFFLGSFASSSVVLHLVPYLQDKGLEPRAAAEVLGWLAGMGIVAKLCGGFLADRISPRYVLALSLLFEILGLLILMQADRGSALWAFVVIFALGQGAIFTLQPLLVGEHFGTDAFGAIYGAMLVSNTVGGALGGPLTGYVFDVAGTYIPIFTAFLLTNLLAILILLLVRPPLKVAEAPVRAAR